VFRFCVWKLSQVCYEFADDVDTELLRMLASKTLQVGKQEKGKKGWNKHSNGAVQTSPVLHQEYG
jgi:hypothetical protein